MINAQATVAPVVFSNEELPQNVDLAFKNQRANAYGEPVVETMGSTVHRIARDGCYYVTNNATIGTAVAFAIVTAFSDTSGLFYIYNADKVKKIHLHYLRLIVGTVGASSTSLRLAVKIDTITRNPTAGNVVASPQNTRSGAGLQTSARIQAFNAAALTLPAASNNVRLVGQAILRSTISVANDELVVYFGGSDSPSGVVGSTAGRVVTHMAPVVIDPGHCATIHHWQPGNAATAPTFEWELGHWER